MDIACAVLEFVDKEILLFVDMSFLAVRGFGL